MKKQNKIISIIGTVTFVTLVAKVLGFVREALQAREFGTSGIADIFTDAHNSTTYIFTTVAYALCIAAIPIISKKLAKSKEEGFAALNNMLCICLSLASLIMVFGLVFPKLYLGDLQAVNELVLYTRILLPSLLVIVATYLYLALLQSLEHYYLQGSLSLPYNISMILYLVIFGDKFGMQGVVVAISLAWLLQLSMTFPALIKEKYRFRFSIDLRADYIWDFLKTALVTIFNTSVFLICHLLNTSSGETLGEGTVSAFGYADKLFSPLSSTLIYSISTVLFPKLNFKFNRDSADEYKKYVMNIVEKTVMVMLPISVVFSAVSNQIISVVFGGGSFNEDSVGKTAAVLSAYALGMMGFGVLDLLNKAFYTMGKPLLPLVVNIIIVALNFALNLVFVKFESGFFIALSTAISLTVGAILMSVIFLRGTNVKESAVKIIKSIIATAVSAGALFALKTYFLNITDGSILQIVKSVGVGCVGMVIYLVVLRLLGEKEIIDFFVSKLKRKGAEK